MWCFLLFFLYKIKDSSPQQDTFPQNLIFIYLLSYPPPPPTSKSNIKSPLCIGVNPLHRTTSSRSITVPVLGVEDWGLSFAKETWDDGGLSCSPLKWKYGFVSFCFVFLGLYNVLS